MNYIQLKNRAQILKRYEVCFIQKLVFYKKTLVFVQSLFCESLILESFCT